MSKTRSFSALAAGLGFLAAACWLVTATFPLAAAPQSVNDFPGVTVDTGGPVMHRTSVMYPDAARLHNIQGVVVVEASLDNSGNVTDTRVLSGPPELRRAAQQAVLQWHFSMEGSSTTRQVKISFELPPGQTGPVTAVTVNPASMGTVNDPEKIAAAEAKIRALRSQIVDQTAALRSSQSEAARQEAAAKLSELQNNVSTLQRNLGPASLAGKRLGRIQVSGMSDQVRDQLLSRLPVHVGDTLSADSYDLTNKAVREFDEHMFVSQGTNPQTGEVAFSIVQGAGPTVAMTAPTTPPTPGVKRITIGGNVQQAKLVSQARPAYPPLAKQARISGVVHLQAVIAKDGTVMDLKVIGGHPLLIPAALEAVKTWVYQTTLLNGEPVEVSTQIDVNFTLTDEGGGN